MRFCQLIMEMINTKGGEDCDIGSFLLRFSYASLIKEEEIGQNIKCG